MSRLWTTLLLAALMLACGRKDTHEAKKPPGKVSAAPRATPAPASPSPPNKAPTSQPAGPKQVSASATTVEQANAHLDANRLQDALVGFSAASRSPDKSVQAAALHGLGVTQRRLGRPRDAVAPLSRAVKLFEELGKPLKAAYAGSSLGNALDVLGQYPEAAKRQRAAIGVMEQHLPADQREPIVNALLGLGGTEMHARDYARADKTLKRALEIAEKQQLPAALRGKLHQNLGVNADMGKRPADAEDHLKKALALKRQAHGELHPGLVTTLNSLAIVVERQGRAAEAIGLYEKAYELAGKALPKDHPTTAQVAFNLALLNHEAGKRDVAAKHCKAALEARQRSLGPQHRATRKTVSLCAEIAKRP